MSEPERTVNAGLRRAFLNGRTDYEATLELKEGECRPTIDEQIEHLQSDIMKAIEQSKMKDFAIQQLTGFQQCSVSPDAGYLAESMGLKEDEWLEIKAEETWLDADIIEAIDRHFEEEDES